MNGRSGEKWVTEFMKISNFVVPLRKPQVTSLARATDFNRLVIEVLFTKYSGTIEKLNLGPEVVYKADTSGLSAVHKPTKALAVKGSKLVGGDIWRKRSCFHHYWRNEADTSGLSAVHKPTKAVAVKGSKLVGSDIWRKRSRCHHHWRNEAETSH
jgi:hypothetical protein